MLELCGGGRAPDDERAAAHRPADDDRRAHDETHPDTCTDHDERGTDDHSAACDVLYERGTYEYRPADAVGYSDH